MEICYLFSTNNNISIVIYCFLYILYCIPFIRYLIEHASIDVPCSIYFPLSNIFNVETIKLIYLTHWTLQIVWQEKECLRKYRNYYNFQSGGYCGKISFSKMFHCISLQMLSSPESCTTFHTAVCGWRICLSGILLRVERNIASRRWTGGWWTEPRNNNNCDNINIKNNKF